MTWLGNSGCVYFILQGVVPDRIKNMSSYYVKNHNYINIKHIRDCN